MVENLENIKHLERIKNFLITPVEKDNFYYYTGKVDVAVSMLKDEIARQEKIISTFEESEAPNERT